MPERDQTRCLIAAGGTGGHVLPALAVAQALEARGAAVTFAGSPDRVESQLVPEAGFELDTFEVSGLPRRPGVELLRGLALAGRAPFACRRILARRRPHVVLGGGGAVSGPMVLAAGTRRIPAALTEADAHLGLSNRLAAPWAQRIFLAFPISGLDPPKYRVTGRPIPVHSRPGSRAEARRRLDLPADEPVLLVFGGSQGARSLNELVVRSFADEGPAVLHLAGQRDFDALRARVSREDYRLLPYTHEFGAALAASSLALARAGGSVFELAAAGLPAVLVPYPHATADHQTKNARFFADGGGALMLPEAELERAPAVVRELLADADRLVEMSKAMLAVARVDAADVIAEELMSLARAGR
ncbi:MAG: UDP-N-acetylglucosamine--N-acetylmuramyl-(pentapeptide) pyrophosphoryl-undecaprenol N-acetylglucosamine transferase [Candidatus Rokuibacteriota bacterium]|nr:MAG: UDP-N-acetylglucosamine--N-acetylmuramyl-(pentapeptide) pyrophosphoryl-undecaprenol N-acetylglucosamine transferase [Candidatus Rokubacteria bacterium]